MRKEVEIYPSMWFVLVFLIFGLWVTLLFLKMQSTNEKLDTLIKIEQQILTYKGE